VADTAGIEFHLSHGDMLRTLRAAGFEVEDLVERVRAGRGRRRATRTSHAAGPSGGRSKRCGSPVAADPESAS
jgi:hypothetical protein